MGHVVRNFARSNTVPLGSEVVASVVGKQNGVIDVLKSDKLTSQLIRATNVWF